MSGTAGAKESTLWQLKEGERCREPATCFAVMRSLMTWINHFKEVGERKKAHPSSCSEENVETQNLTKCHGIE